MACLSCNKATAQHHDPCDPPLSEKRCLCHECYREALEVCIEEAENKISEWRRRLDKLSGWI